MVSVMLVMASRADPKKIVVMVASGDRPRVDMCRLHGDARPTSHATPTAFGVQICKHLRGRIASRFPDLGPRFPQVAIECVEFRDIESSRAFDFMSGQSAAFAWTLLKAAARIKEQELRRNSKVQSRIGSNQSICRERRRSFEAWRGNAHVACAGGGIGKELPSLVADGAGAVALIDPVNVVDLVRGGLHWP